MVPTLDLRHVGLLFLMVHSAQPLIEKLFEIETCGPPQIQNTMLNQTRNPGESVYFRCQNAREGDPHTHQISRVSPDHEGLYTCVVGNVLGSAEASAYLQVNSGTRGFNKEFFSLIIWSVWTSLSGPVFAPVPGRLLT